MSWSEVDGVQILTSVSHAESERFGRPVRRVIVGRRVHEDTVHLVENVLVEAEAEPNALVIVRVPSDRVDFNAAVIASGAHSLFCGTLMYWDMELPLGAVASVQLGPGVRVWTTAAGNLSEEDRLRAVDLMPDIFDGYQNHYSYNPALPSEVVAEGYREWSARTLSGDGGHVSQVAVNDELAAVASWRVDGDVAEIELAGVMAPWRRRGLYLHLIREIAAEAYELGATRLLISTQAANAAVQAAWTRVGMRPIAAIDTFHVERSPR